MEVYGVAITAILDKYEYKNEPSGTDSLIWVFLGTHTRLGMILYTPTLDLKLMDFCSFKTEEVKGALPSNNLRQENFVYHWRKHKTKYSNQYEADETDTTVCVYELYFDSAHFFNAYDTFYVGCYHGNLYHQFEFYRAMGYAEEISAEGGDNEYGFADYALDGPQILDLSQHAVGDTVRDGHCSNYNNKFNKETGKLEYGLSCGPFYPIVGLRCTTPKAVRWTAIGGDTARFEWQLHDEAENFIVEVEDMIANTTTHDTLPSWQNYYTVHGLDTNTDCLQLRVQKSTRYTMKYYDTVVYSPWYELPLLGHLPEPPDTTTPIDTTQPVDTNQGILMAQGLQFSLQPNPVHDKAEVQLAAPAGEGCTATLTDLSGRELQRIVVPPATQTLTIDLITLPAGTYLLTLATSTASSTQRLVKNK